METSPTELYLPPALHYPIKIISIDASLHTFVKRTDRLFTYSYVHVNRSPPVVPETRFGTWESAIEGTLHKWFVAPGDVITQSRAVAEPIALIGELCKHGMQHGGLCVICGKDMTINDYIGPSDSARASIQMTHSKHGPTVSREVAERFERETADHLLKSRKLSLIVDLDQTIVHATVDPTVGEWITEGEAWEARQEQRRKRQAMATSNSPDDSDESDNGDSEDEEECNPNWEALKDVKKFWLAPESFNPSLNRKGKNKAFDKAGMYYIKPRPGWQEFLQSMSTKYEMHVYTMGTRAYAQAVCAAIDPDNKIFGGRLLSRDESDSLTTKSLQRLFPCDTSMVVIIDDRADVWDWSPNLIKVIPYDFFVGIGDINSANLPQIAQIAVSKVAQTPRNEGALTSPRSGTDTAGQTMKGDELAERELGLETMVKEKNASLETQLEERPLAKKQEELTESNNDGQMDRGASATTDESTISTPVSEKRPRKALLRNDDYELQRITKLLDEVHMRFYDAYQGRMHLSVPSGSRPHNVTSIIPQLRSEVLAGVRILFSSVIPLDTRPENSEIWHLAHRFGARCCTELSPDVTHMVTAKRSTAKVDLARKRGGSKIVWVAWLTDSIALWQRQDEHAYLLDAPLSEEQADPEAAGEEAVSPLHVSSSDIDLEIESDEWEDAVVSDAAVQESKQGLAAVSGLQLDGVDWADVNDEVEAAMNESEEEEEEDGRDGEWDVSSVASTVGDSSRLKRKRTRSVTPMTVSGVGGLLTPFSKRKKMVAERSGYSKLKKDITEDQLTNAPEAETKQQSCAVENDTHNGDQDDGDDDEEEGDDDEDDFLARELEEEWG